MITLTTLKGIYYDNDRIFSGAVLEAGNVCITCMLCNNIVRFSITNFIEYLDSTLVFVYRQRHETSNFAFFLSLFCMLVWYLTVYNVLKLRSVTHYNVC